MWPDFIDKYIDMAPIIYSFLRCFRIFLAPIEADKIVRQRIESAIGISLRDHNPLNRQFFDDAVYYSFKNRRWSALMIFNRGFINISGLQKEMEI